ncbi:hypothetical protein [Streptomyces gilvosporeus]|uniref:hypothetical protein n=1 Tax=Streptomyces gilvosporeus TaxID=553510 RepID=UPI003AAE5BEC
MNSAPHLLNEDREEFARLLDEALRAAGHRPDGLASGTGKHLSAEQLRTMALSATTAIAACATAEYQRYVQLRAALRAPAAASSAGGAAAVDGDAASEGATGSANGTGPVAVSCTGTGEGTALDESAESAGAGLAAMSAVLVPVLAGIAAVLFLLIGYVLRFVGPDASVARPLISVGWVFAVLTAAGALVAMAGLVVTALRNGSTASRTSRADEALAMDLDRAHDAWRQALLERGLLPFLSEALVDADPGADPTDYVPRPVAAPENRIPTLGYSRPAFSSRDSGSSGSRSRPRYSSPDFTSPEYGGSGAGPGANSAGSGSGSGGGASE